MRDVSFKFLTTKIEKDKIGVEKEVTVKSSEIPIIKVEDVYAKERYEAEQLGYKPTLRLRISRLNYEDARELIYMGKTYTIIRPQEITADEIVLICEEKVKNVK